MNNLYIYKKAVILLEKYYDWHMHVEIDEETGKPVAVLDYVGNSLDYVGLVLQLPEIFDAVMIHVVAAALYVMGNQYLREWIDEEGGEG